MKRQTALVAIGAMALAGCVSNRPRPDKPPTGPPGSSVATTTSGSAEEPEALPPAWIGTLGFHATVDRTFGGNEHWQGTWDGTWTIRDAAPAAGPSTYLADFSINATAEHTIKTPCGDHTQIKTESRSELESTTDSLEIHHSGDQFQLFTLHAGTLAGLDRERFTDSGCNGPPIDQIRTDVSPPNSPDIKIELTVQAGTRTVTGQAPAQNPGPISVALLPWTSSFGDSTPTVRWTLTLLPGFCRDEPVTPAMQRSAGLIGGQSDTFERLAGDLSGRVKFGDATGQLPPGTPGRTVGITNGDARIEVDYAQVDSRFQLASVLAHEYGHAADMIRRGFTAGDVAPAMTLREYLALRWDGEAAAFDLQAKILAEIAATSPELLPCVQRLMDQDRRLRPMSMRERELSLVNSDEYDATTLTSQYQRDHAVPIRPEAQAAWDAFVRSNNFTPIIQRWSGYAP